MDTGTGRMMMNLKILPRDFYISHIEYFKAADDQVFKTSLITKSKISIKFFPRCIIWTKILGSSLSDKDFLGRMDVYCRTKNLQNLPTVNVDLQKWNNI